MCPQPLQEQNYFSFVKGQYQPSPWVCLLLSSVGACPQQHPPLLSYCLTSSSSTTQAFLAEIWRDAQISPTHDLEMNPLFKSSSSLNPVLLPIHTVFSGECRGQLCPKSQWVNVHPPVLQEEDGAEASSMRSLVVPSRTAPWYPLL